MVYSCNHNHVIVSYILVIKTILFFILVVFFSILVVLFSFSYRKYDIHISFYVVFFIIIVTENFAAFG